MQCITVRKLHPQVVRSGPHFKELVIQWQLAIQWLLLWQQCFIANQNPECYFTCHWIASYHWTTTSMKWGPDFSTMTDDAKILHIMQLFSFFFHTELVHHSKYSWFLLRFYCPNALVLVHLLKHDHKTNPQSFCVWTAVWKENVNNLFYTVAFVMGHSLGNTAITHYLMYIFYKKSYFPAFMVFRHTFVHHKFMMDILQRLNSDYLIILIPSRWNYEMLTTIHHINNP